MIVHGNLMCLEVKNELRVFPLHYMQQDSYILSPQL